MRRHHARLARDWCSPPPPSDLNCADVPYEDYHEIFHAFVLVGATCHYIALVFVVLPASA